MKHSIAPNPTTNHTHRPNTGQKLTIHYSLNGRAIYEAESHLTADMRFIALPIPVIHRIMMGQ